MPGAAGDGVAVDGALAQNAEHHAEHEQREHLHTLPVGGENQEDDVLEHDQHAEKAENQQVEDVMHMGDALLFLPVMGEHIGAPEGGEAGLNGGDKVGYPQAEGIDALRRGGGVVEQKGGGYGTVEIHQHLTGGQRQPVGHHGAVHRRGQPLRLLQTGLAPEGDGGDAEAHHRGQREPVDVGGEKAGQQVNQVEAGLHPERLQRVGAQIVFQPEQHVEIPHQHIQPGVQKQQRHDAPSHGGVVLAEGEGADPGGKKQAAHRAQHQREGAGQRRAGPEQPPPGGAGGRFMVKPQQALVQAEDAQVHEGGGGVHELGGKGDFFGAENALHDDGRPRDAEPQIGGHGIFHHAPGEGLARGGSLFV